VKDLLIYGAGGFAREALQIVHAINAINPTWHFRGFVVDPEHAGAKESVNGHPVTSDPAELTDDDRPEFLVAIGNPFVRQKIVAKLAKKGCIFPTIVHPKAWIGEHVTLNPGTIICAGCCLTTDIEIGQHCHLNLTSTVGHDARLGEFCTISPGVNISGNVRLGNLVEIGTGAALLPKVSIGSGSVIGAGAVVLKDVPANVTAVGVPAQVKGSPQ
jgi:sugar O-acyltransferase (sialic acid O-acetyltransferase NeuD family)